MKELKTVEKLLNNKGYSCVISDGNEMVYTSKEKGIKPLMEFYKSGFLRSGTFFVADKIIGKGAAFLLVLLPVKGLYTPVISESALKLLYKYSMAVKYDKIVPFIKNRTGEGRCPIESAVIDEEDPGKALDKIHQALEALKQDIKDNR